MNAGGIVFTAAIQKADAQTQSNDPIPDQVLDMSLLDQFPNVVRKIEQISIRERPNRKCTKCFVNFAKMFFVMLYKFRKGEEHFWFCFDRQFQKATLRLYEDLNTLHCFCMITHSVELYGKVCVDCESMAMTYLLLEFNKFFQNEAGFKPNLHFSTAAACIYYYTWNRLWGTCLNKCIQDEYISSSYHSSRLWYNPLGFQ